MPSASTMTLGHALLLPVYRRALAFPVLLLLFSVGAAVWTERTEWLVIGGSVIAAWGTWLWGSRLFRLTPDHADAPLPPSGVMVEPGKPWALTADRLNEMARRASDNHRAVIGIWLSIVGGLLAGGVPALLDLLGL